MADRVEKNEELPDLRQKVKLQPSKLVRVSFSSLTAQPRELTSVTCAEKEESLTNRDEDFLRLPHLRLGAPCPLNTSIKFAELVYQNWNSNSLPPRVPTARAPSRGVFSSPRPSTVSGRTIKRNSKRIGRSSFHWLENYIVLANLIAHCPLETFFVFHLLNKNIYKILHDNLFWMEMLKKMNLTPLLKFHNISSSYRDFFFNEVMTSNILSGLYIFENVYPPTLQHSLSLQTSSLNTCNVPNSVSSSAGDLEEGNPVSEQSKYQSIRMLIAPVKFGSQQVEMSRVQLLIRRWPPFDQYKAYLGTCMFSWEQKCFLFNFLDESSESPFVCTSAFTTIEEGESTEFQRSECEKRQLVCTLSLKKETTLQFEPSRFSVLKYIPP